MITLLFRRRRSTIRRSTNADIAAIYVWLVEQDSRDVPGTFICNWTLTEKYHREGKLIVFVDGESGIAVAYQWGGLLSSGILEVRHDMRGRGIGKKLVERRIAEAYKREECFLHIQCKPSTSISFWVHMGFKMLESARGNYAYRILEKRHALPVDGIPVSVSIRFFPEERNWNEDAVPLCIATPKAVRTSDGNILLAERVSCFEPLYPMARDPVVEVKVDGLLIYCEKAKYENAQRLGVLRCRNGFFIDRLKSTLEISGLDNDD